MSQPSTHPAAHPAEIVREFGPFPGASSIAGVTHDGIVSSMNVRRSSENHSNPVDPEAAGVESFDAVPAPRFTPLLKLPP